MMLEKVEQTIQKFNMLKRNDRVIVAVSGGPDSVALVHALNKLKKKWQLSLHLAHLNHMIRFKEADADSFFVENLAKKLKVPLTFKKLKVKDFAREQKLSLEEAARRVRFDFLYEVAKENFAGKIALGHSRDDQAETVLMRFLRGSGLCGLRGIPPKRKLQGCLIIRPLIELKREQIMHFLALKNIAFRIDSSNLKSLHFRNKIRNELFPLLEKNFNPNIKELLVNFAENISDDFDFLENKGQAEFKEVRVNSSNGELAINFNKFFSLHRALQKLVARSAIKELKGDVRMVDYRHWKELKDLVENRPKNSIVDLPAGISVIKKGPHIIFYRRNMK